MYGLSIIKHNGGCYIDSREVAEVIGKQHGHLMRDIAGYVRTMQKINQSNFGVVDFFVESTYLDTKGETRPCYLVSKMGCEMVANKLTGEKGVLFTAAYVALFNRMEQNERANFEALTEQSAPRLGNINACAQIVIRGMKNFGATPEQVMRFIKETYEPFGISVDFEPDDLYAPRWYNANGIAKECGMYSLNGKPHGQAAASILNEILCIDEEHKRVEKDYYGFQIGISTLYDSYALVAVLQWLVDNGCPDDIRVYGRTYHIQYCDI